MYDVAAEKIHREPSAYSYRQVSKLIFCMYSSSHCFIPGTEIGNGDSLYFML